MCVDLPSTKADITLPNVDNDRLILVASFRVLPSAPDFDWRSLPYKEAIRLPHQVAEKNVFLTAKSTMCNLPARIRFPPSGPVSLHSMIRVKIACDRLLRSFIKVWPVWPNESSIKRIRKKRILLLVILRLKLPARMSASISVAEWQACAERPSA